MTLLIVDDEVIAVQGLLSGVRWSLLGVERTLTAYSARQARELLEQEHVDMALLDIEMPEENGIGLLRWMRRNGHHQPCAFFTCNATFYCAQEALRLQCADYILKPASYVAVEDTLRKLEQQIRSTRATTQLADFGRRWLLDQTQECQKLQKEPADSPQIIARITDHIQTHLSEPLSVEGLAAMASMNADYMNRLFKRINGQSVNKYIIEKRMELAALLLQQGKLTSYAVAEAVGYDTYANFVNMFKKVHGVPPSSLQEGKCINPASNRRTTTYHKT